MNVSVQACQGLLSPKKLNGDEILRDGLIVNVG